MTTTLTLDASGGLFLPAALLADAHFNEGAAVEVEVAADRILVKSILPERQARLVEKDGRLVFESGPAHPDEEANVRIERRGKRLVIVGGPPFDAVAAIKADREARDEVLARRVRGA